ncbi:MAG: hypothetical protein ACJ8DI_35265 [Ktedonobacteraceae bacterium]
MTADQVPLHLLECWLLDLQADRADGTIKRYRGATLRFLSWYQQQAAGAGRHFRLAPRPSLPRLEPP